MKDTITLLNERKSVRSFDNRTIPQLDQRVILNAALQAPTAGNMTLYTILNITDPKLKLELAESCDHQAFIATAPMVLVFCADYHKWYELFRKNEENTRKPGTGDLMLAMDDALIASMNTVAAAEALGIGSCYIGDILENYEHVKQLLHLPQYVVPACMLVLGYPSELQKNRKKPARFDLDDVVQENTYKEKDLRAMLVKQTGIVGEAEMEDYIIRFRKRKWDSDFSKEMTRSVQAMIDAWNKGEEE
ncbi:MAG: nitroreductase family protein [Bulleidia sp.]|nr:nitroreductase family protein [Bulleidia sp.]